MGEEGGGDGLTGGERLVYREVENEGLGIDVADINTTFMSEENGVTLTLGGDADVVFSCGGMREEGLDDEVAKGACDGFDLGITDD